MNKNNLKRTYSQHQYIDENSSYISTGEPYYFHPQLQSQHQHQPQLQHQHQHQPQSQSQPQHQDKQNVGVSISNIDIYTVIEKLYNKIDTLELKLDEYIQKTDNTYSCDEYNEDESSNDTSNIFRTKCSYIS